MKTAKSRTPSQDAKAHAEKGDKLIQEAQETLLAQLNGVYRDLQAGKRLGIDGDDESVSVGEPQS